MPTAYRTPSNACLDLIREFEGLRLKAYPDPASGGEPWTIGYGHTAGVRSGDECSGLQADHWLAGDALAASQAVLRMVHVPLEQCQFDALTSWVFNLGERRCAGSTLVRMLNLGMTAERTADQFLLWVRGGGRVMPGLVRRRQAERAMFLGLDWRAAGGGDSAPSGDGGGS